MYMYAILCFLTHNPQRASRKKGKGGGGGGGGRGGGLEGVDGGGVARLEKVEEELKSTYRLLERKTVEVYACTVHVLLHNYAVNVQSFCFSASCEQMERMERERDSLRKAGVHTHRDMYTRPGIG